MEGFAIALLGYSYDADLHCIRCATKYIVTTSATPIRDSEGNLLHPIFDTDEAGDTPDHCGDCGAFLDTSWTGETVGYAIDKLWEYVQETVNKPWSQGEHHPVLTTWREHLKGIYVEPKDYLVMVLYDKTREWEVRNARPE